MARAYRTDFGTLGSVQKTPSGGLRVPGVVAREGVLRYSDGAREWGEYVPRETLFDADSLATLRGAPVTDGHPQAPVTPETWGTDARGHLGDDPHQEGQDLVASVLVQHADLVRLVASGERRELSAGYECDVDPTPGTWNGEPYDGVQRARRYNHVALLPVGGARAGRDAALRMDGAAVQVQRADSAQETGSMKLKLKIGGREVHFDAEDPKPAQEAIDACATKSDADLAELSAVKDALMKALQQVAAMEAKLAASAAAQPAPVTEEMVPEEVLDSALAKRAALVESARKVLGDSVDLKGQKPSQIRRAVVAKVLPSVKLDSLSEDTITGMFVAATEAAASSHVAALHQDAAGEPAQRTDEDDDLTPAQSLARRTHKHFDVSRTAQKVG